METEASYISIGKCGLVQRITELLPKKLTDEEEVADLGKTYVSRSKNMTESKRLCVEADPATKDFYATIIILSRSLFG